MIPFEYRTPKNLKEVHASLKEFGTDAKIVAGGTALVIMMKQRLVRPACLVSLRSVRGLDGIEVKDGGLRIGGLATHRDVESSALVRRRLPLQCDPTVIYAARLAGRYDGFIHVSDLQRDSPYNTYLRRGLPPGPIANPGRASLDAVLNPPKSDFLYFVSNTEGGHFFARTSAEHARNVVRYRRLRRAREKAAAGAAAP